MRSPRRALVRAAAGGLFVLLFAALTALPAAANPKYAGLVVDVLSGETLYADHADAPRYPASLTKIMTLYIVFEELKAGRLTLDTKLKVSKYAAARPPSKIGFRPGGRIAVRDAIKALVTKSANDVATAIGENISGSEAKFAARMTRTARRLGMASTTFRNASGLPNPKQRTTARDMARLGIAIQRDFPQYYGVFQTRTFSYGKRRYGNHNRLLGRVKGVDGIKTGYIRASGFNLVTSVRRDGRHIVAVVMGGRTGASRNKHMTQLIGRTLPKASVGTPSRVIAWSDSGPPPKPRAKPADALLVARLKRTGQPAEPASPIDGLLAFASETRAAAPPLATAALRAVIAQGSDGPIPAGPFRADEARPAAFAPSALAAVSSGRSSLQRSVPAGAAPVELASTDPAAAATPSGTSAPEPARARLDAAFDAFGDADGSGGIEALVAQLTAPASGSPDRLAAATPVIRIEPRPERRESAPTAGDGSRAGAASLSGWQIQVGAVPDRARIEALHSAAEKVDPDLKARTRITSHVATDDGLMFRARFAGFASKRQAEDACKRFAHHNRPCWAVSM